MKKGLVSLVLACGVLALPRSVAAQSRPLLTQDPETVPPGDILFEAGVERDQATFYPATGLQGNLFRLGTMGASFGISSVAEIQVDGGFRDFLSISQRNPSAPLASTVTAAGDTTSAFEDLLVGAKVRFVTETASRPSMAVRFWTELPSASTESGLGVGTTDFNANLLIGKTVQSVRLVANFGFGVLPDPVSVGPPTHVLEYGFSLARAVMPGVEFVGEINGRWHLGMDTPPAGTESRSIVQLGARYTHGPVRLDAALMVGVTTYDPTWGVTGGVTWVFKAFTMR